ncbi:hypothetical protein [Bacteroides coprosuis]|uniref:hypothetical protein n=1 Tax=Bacteroides coprosuis TaxID=151276 RepID=UPI001D28D4B6|nr:hypothetical protein [Bacteroides coprosuis]HJD92064.1 hypothetical protein [Bacteroides coprosuis]
MDKEYILEMIKKLQKEKKEKRIEPAHIIDIELLNLVVSEARDCLNILFKEGKIKVTRTINHKAVFVDD